MSLFMLLCQSEFTHHVFLVFDTGFFHCYVISLAILIVIATHLTPTQVSLVAPAKTLESTQPGWVYGHEIF